MEVYVLRTHLENLKALARVSKGKLKLYFAANMLYLLAWRFIPAFIIVNYIVEEYGGNLFHIALFEASISIATITSMFIVNRIPEHNGFNVMILSIIGVTITTLIFYVKLLFQIHSSALQQECLTQHGLSSIGIGSSKPY